VPFASLTYARTAPSPAGAVLQVKRMLDGRAFTRTLKARNYHEKDKMRLRNIFTTLLIFISISSLASLEPGSVYSAQTNWNRLSGNGKDIVPGITFTKISIIQKNINSVELKIYKKMDPFGDYLDLKIEALDNNGIYYFKGIDNCRNIIKGYIKEIGADLEFYLNCIEYHEYGSSFAPLYDERVILKIE